MRNYNLHYRFLRRLLFGAAAVALLWPSAGLAQAQTSSSSSVSVKSEGTGQIEEVVVTAERRLERNLDVPIAISVFSASRIQDQNITSMQDLQGSVPSLTVGPNGQGSREVASPTIRGQAATFEASPSVVEYYDEVPLPAPISLSQQGAPGSLFDLANIQVLEGPQGTLFGRNTTGGAILLVPQKPTNKLSGYISLGSGSYSLQDYEGAVNIPVISNKLMIRVSGQYYDRGGFTHDIIWHVNRDNAHWYTGRFEVLFRPTGRLQDFLLLYGTESHDNGTGIINEGYNIPALAAYHICSTSALAPAAYSCNVYAAASAQAKALGPRAVAYSLNAFEITNSWGAINKTDYDLSDNVTLRNIASYQWFYSNYAYDPEDTVLQQQAIDPYAVPPPGTVTLPYSGTPVTYTNAASPIMPRDLYEDITEEAQIQGVALGDKLNYTAGAFYYLQEPAGMMSESSINFCPAMYTGSSAFCGPATQASAVTNRSEAVYAQGTLDLGILDKSLDGLRLTAGYRYTWDSVAGWDYSFRPKTGTGDVICSSTNAIVPAASGTTGCYSAAKLHSTAPSWIISLTYKILPDLMTYGKVSHSYKSGGINPYAVRKYTQTFEPEYDTTYEAGVKSDVSLIGLPTRIDADYYYTDYRHIQLAVPDTNFATGAVGAAVQNANARIQGVELAATIRLFRFLQLGGNFSYTDAKYTKYRIIAPQMLPDCTGALIPTGGKANLACLPFNRVIPRIYNLNATVDIPIHENWGALSVFIDYAHNSEQNVSTVYLPSTVPGATIPPYGVLNMSVDWKNIFGKPVDLSVFATNVTDATYRIANFSVYKSALFWSTMYGAPRMIGFKLRYHFGD